MLEWGEDQRPGKGSGAGLTKPHAKMRTPSADPCACRSPHHCVVVRKTNKTQHLEHQQSARLLISCHRSRTYTSELARSLKHGDNGPTVGWFARSRHRALGRPRDWSILRNGFVRLRKAPAIAEARAYSFEAANPRHEHEWRVWESVKLPEGKLLIPGIIAHSSDLVEHPELVAERIVSFAGAVGWENVIAGADCGFCEFCHDLRGASFGSLGKTRRARRRGALRDPSPLVEEAMNFALGRNHDEDDTQTANDLIAKHLRRAGLRRRGWPLFRLNWKLPCGRRTPDGATRPHPAAMAEMQQPAPAKSRANSGTE